jgi:hypothetical protein
MARVFPDAVFVAIVRHPGGSMASNMNRWKFSLSRAASHFERYTREMLRMAAKYRHRTVLLRYEELLLQPEPVLRSLLEWLGEDWSDAVLEHHRVQSDRGGREVVEGRNRVSDPLDVSRISKWTSTIGEAQQQRLDRRFGRLVEFLGYSMTDPAVLDSVNERDAPLTSGSEVKARMKDFADLDLATRGRVPRFEHYYHPREFTLEAPGALAAARRETAVAKLQPVSTKRHVMLMVPRPLRQRAGRVRRRLRRTASKPSR